MCGLRYSEGQSNASDDWKRMPQALSYCGSSESYRLTQSAFDEGKSN